MLEAIIYPAAAVLATDAIGALDKWLNGTRLEGRGAFIVATILAIVAAAVKVAYSGEYQTFDLPTVQAAFAEIFTAAQLIYWTIVKFLKEKLLLDF